jgi:hypothetical protein
MTSPDDGFPLWQKLVAGLLVVLVALAVIFGWARLGSDLWPPDRSFVGPNIVAAIIQWAIIFVVGVLVWPPTRRRLHRFMDRKLERVHAELDAHRNMHDAHAARLDALHEKLDRLLNQKEKP